MKRTNVATWVMDESLYCTGVKSNSVDINLRLFSMRAEGKDARFVEAIMMTTDSVVKLQIIKALLYRGRLDEATTIINALPKIHGQVDVEVLLEQARLAAFSGGWTQCTQLCNTILNKSDLPSITLLTTLQVRALSLFELGSFKNALNDISKVYSLSRLFPLSPALIYAELLEIQILSCFGQQSSARIKLDLFWERQTKNEHFNLDILLTLLRTEAVYDASCGKTPIAWHMAAYRVAELLGDELYKRLSLIELSYMSNLFRYNDIGTAKFCRISILRAEVESQDQFVSTSAKRIINYKQKTPSNSIGSMESASKIMNRHLTLLIDLESCKITKPTLRFQEALTALSKGNQSKEAFFISTYGLKGYNKEKHSDLIHKVISRLRKKYGVSICIRDGKIEMGDSLIFVGCCE